MKRYFAVVSMMCLFVLANIAGAVAQEVQKANPATDFEYDLNEASDGVIIKKYTGTSTEVVIPAEIEDFPVVEVGSYAFSDKNVVSVVLPDSVGTVGEKCFSHCESLQKIILPKNLKALSQKLFYGCTALKEIILPNGIEIIYEGAFSYSGLESITIPDSVKIIKPDNYNYGAFADCKNLQTVNIGNGTEVIGTQAFSGCTKLSRVTIGSGLKMINNEAFHNCSSLTTVNINVEKVEYGDSVFSGCSSLSLKEKKKIRDTGYTGGF